MEDLPFKLKWLGHASFLVEYKGLYIYIDPYDLREGLPKADIIFITHEHYDHCSCDDVKKIVKENTKLIGTFDVLEKVGDIVEETLEVIPYQEYSVLGIKFETMPAYNINKSYHPKEKNWVGYLIDFDNTILYHTGDTDLIPEMNEILANVLLAPVGGTYTMNAKEAADLAKKIKPKYAIPMHYGKIVGNIADAEEFKSLCEKYNINAIIMQEYKD